MAYADFAVGRRSGLLLHFHRGRRPLRRARRRCHAAVDHLQLRLLHRQRQSGRADAEGLEGKTLVADTVTGSWALADWFLQQRGVDLSKVAIRILECPRCRRLCRIDGRTRRRRRGDADRRLAAARRRGRTLHVLPGLRSGHLAAACQQRDACRASPPARGATGQRSQKTSTCCGASMPPISTPPNWSNAIRKSPPR